MYHCCVSDAIEILEKSLTFFAKQNRVTSHLAFPSLIKRQILNMYKRFQTGGRTPGAPALDLPL
jgi:hypothetical protein